MSNWYNKVRRQTEPIFQSIINHKFIVKLIDGSLPLDVFQFYVNQDSLYLAEYKKVLATVGLKCNSTEDIQFFLNSATDIINVENELHQNFINNKVFTKEPSPICELYTSYLTRIVNNHSLEESLAVVLPCFTIYKEVGDYIFKNQTNKENNYYKDWINAYSGEKFANSVKQAIKITNKYAKNASKDQLNRMEIVFIKASKLEWLFWDSSYIKEKWKI